MLFLLLLSYRAKKGLALERIGSFLSSGHFRGCRLARDLMYRESGTRDVIRECCE